MFLVMENKEKKKENIENMFGSKFFFFLLFYLKKHGEYRNTKLKKTIIIFREH